MEEKQIKILEELLYLLNSGSNFSNFTLNSAASNLEITNGELNLIFPYGLFEVAEMLLLKHIKEIEITSEGGITNGVKLAVLSSFSLLSPNKKALRKIIRFLILPSNIISSTKFFWKISDAIWKGLNVNDTTFSFYSKRAILSGIYANCFFYFLLSNHHLKLETILTKQLNLLSKFKR